MMNVTIPAPKYPIGFKFVMPARGKREARNCEIVDYITPVSHDGTIGKGRYHVAMHYIFGQKLIDRDVVQTTIDIATNNGKENLL